VSYNHRHITQYYPTESREQIPPDRKAENTDMGTVSTAVLQTPARDERKREKKYHQICTSPYW